MAMRWSALLGLLLSLLPAMASAGVIAGTVRLPSGAGGNSVTLNPYPGRASSLPGARGPVRGLVSDAVIFLDRIPVDTDSLLATHATRAKLAQKDQCFQPRVVAVAQGGTVAFPNLDPIYHNVFSPSPIKRFDLGKYPKGQSRNVTFSRPGVVNVFCDIHSDMEAFVLVLPHHGFTRPDAEGRYALPDLPEGHYVVRAWHPDLREIRREIDVPADGRVTLDLGF